MTNTRNAKGRAILNHFRDQYLAKNSKEYDVNYGMIVMAEKLSDFYPVSEVKKVMEYYFRYNDGSWFEFAGNIDKIKKSMAETESEKKRFTELEKNTIKQIKKIRKLKVANAGPRRRTPKESD